MRYRVSELRESVRFPKSMREAPNLSREFRVPFPTPKRALLINPFYPKDPHGSSGKHVLTPSQALTSIAAATPDEWEVEYWDENLLQGPPPADPFPQVVGITVHLTFARRAYELAAWYRERGAVVVFGGPHVASCPGECAEHADTVCIGDGVRAWPRILQDIEAGTLDQRYFGSYRDPLADSTAVRRESLDSRSFLTTASLIATRGCRNRCGFCFLATDGLHMPYQCREVEDVVREFESTGEPYGVFIDNNLGADPDYLRKLCRGLRNIDRIWSAAVTLDVTDDPSLVREMALAGCTGVFVGFETLSAINLDEARKHSPRPEDYERRVRVFHDSGIQVNGSFVLGFDDDGPDVFEKTVAWIEETRLECATFHILTPYPGTPFFRKLESEGRLLHRDWALYDTSHCVFRPRRMEPEELEEGYGWCYRRLFSLGSIWRRRPPDPSAVPGYLGMSLLYKKTNFLWPFLIRHRLTHRVWHPVVEAARRRHVRYRRRLAVRRASAAVLLPTAPGV